MAKVRIFATAIDAEGREFRQRKEIIDLYFFNEKDIHAINWMGTHPDNKIEIEIDGVPVEMTFDKESVKTFSDPADVSISDEDNWANVSISHKIPKNDS